MLYCQVLCDIDSLISFESKRYNIFASAIIAQFKLSRTDETWFSLFVQVSLAEMMVKSQLCQRIDLCGSIDQLNKDGCWEVIRLLSDILGKNSLNRLVTIIVSNTHGILSYDDLQKFEKEFDQLLSSNSQYIKEQQSTTTVDTLNNRKTLEKEHVQQSFPLHRLPIDIIQKTSLFLNEKDIFQFEQCCRLFYTMINNTSYLKQTNNFKTFEITNRRFAQLAQSKYSFFKYSKAMTLQFDNTRTVVDRAYVQAMSEFFGHIHDQWDKIEKIRTIDGLFDNLFNSIKSLRFTNDGIALLSKMPLKIMFGLGSQLERMELNHRFWYYDIEYFQRLVKEFELNYNEGKKWQN